MGRDFIGISAAQLRSPESPTWVGEGPDPPRFCLGTENGKIFWASPDHGVEIDDPPVIGSGESINGVAFTDSLMAVSNRREVFVLVTSGPDQKRIYLQEGGAHGVIASKGGRIVAPMGGDGLLVIQAREDGRHTRVVLKALGADPYFYQTIQLGPPDRGVELLASACRNDGLVLTPVGPGTAIHTMDLVSRSNSLSGRDSDVVSLCSLNRADYPYALALLAMDGSVYFSPDARTGSFTGMVLKELQGTPYSVHSAQGHLFILTSEKLYVMRDVADRAARHPAGHPGVAFKSFSRKVDAVDCSIAYQEYLLLVEEDYATVHRVSELSKLFRMSDGPGVLEPSSQDIPISTVEPRFSDAHFKPHQVHALDQNPQVLLFA